MDTRRAEVLETYGDLALQAIYSGSAIVKYEIINLKTKRVIGENKDFLNIESMFESLVLSGEYSN